MIMGKSKLTSQTDGTLPDIKTNVKSSCIIYKFNSRPPCEGFILILVIALIVVVVIWWLVK